MGEFEEETYSTVFAALRHPLRRRILRTLSQSPQGFTDLQNSFNVNGAVLSHHLDAMKDLVCKTEEGKYSLSTMGEGALALMERVEEPPKTLPPATSARGGKRLNILQAIVVLTAIVLLLSGAYLTSISSAQTSYDLPYQLYSVNVPTQIGGNVYETSTNTTLPPPSELLERGSGLITVGFRAIENVSSGVYNITLNYLEYSPQDDMYVQKQMYYDGEFLPIANLEGDVFSAYLRLPLPKTQQQPVPQNVIISIWTNTTQPDPALLNVRAPISDGSWYVNRPYENQGTLLTNIGMTFLVASLMLSILRMSKKLT
jgi:DNA-binding transcriptional ArsR family regulator